MEAGMERQAQMLRAHLARFGGWAFSHIPGLRQLWARTTTGIAEQVGVPWSPLGKPLRACRIALITTGGVHLRSQPPFDMSDTHGDPTYRDIAANTPYSDLTITHQYYDHSDADRDLNILFPLQLVAELADRGVIGSLATSYSFMGHIEAEHIDTLLERTAPEVTNRLKEDGVDAVLLTPA